MSDNWSLTVYRVAILSDILRFAIPMKVEGLR